MKYKAMLEDNEILINFVHAIFSKNLTEEEEIKRPSFGKIPTKEQLQEFKKRGFSNYQISDYTGWGYSKVCHYIMKYNLGKWKRTKNNSK